VNATGPLPSAAARITRLPGLSQAANLRRRARLGLEGGDALGDGLGRPLDDIKSLAVGARILGTGGGGSPGGDRVDRTVNIVVMSVV